MLVKSISFGYYKNRGGDAMVHEEYVRMVPHADTAVLFIHGIVGTPNHFRDLIPLVELVPESWSVCNLLLDGHGKSVEDFANTSIENWHSQVWGTFEKLSRTHERVILVAHSMGTLFSIQLAAQYPEKIPCLFLLAVPLRPKLGFSIICNSLKLVLGKLRDDVPQEYAIKRACGVTPTKKVWKYLAWLPRFWELFHEIIKTEKILSNLTVPAAVFQSYCDELVARRSETILTQCQNMSVHPLQNSSHFYYHPNDLQRIQACFTQMIKEAHG